MAKEIFGRHEAKYCLDNHTFQLFYDEISTYLKADKYNQDGKRYRIYNVYADTIDNNVIRTSIDKPKYKEKIRIRSYQEFKDEDIVFLEIKKKYNKFVNKRRTKIKYKDAVRFVEQGIVPQSEDYMNHQVIRELKYFIHQEKLELKVFLSYERLAFFSKEHSDLRITFDTNIQTKRGNQTYQLLDDNIWLMEIKAEKAFPLWLVKLLAKYKIYKQSFSKYGKEYEHYLKCEKNMTSQVIKQECEESKNYVRNDFKYEY